MDHLETAIYRDPSHNQPPHADTIAYTRKIVLFMRYKNTVSLRIPKIQDTICKTHETQEDQSVGTLSLLRMGNIIPMERVTEIKFGAVKKGWTI